MLLVDFPNNSYAFRPRLAVIIPIFRHSVLLIDAIESILSQIASFQISIVLVNDGCPFIETDEVCREYALTYPGQIIYLKKINEGLSTTRNIGITYALKRWDSIDAIYLLDADNVLRKPALGRAMLYLDSHKDMSWIYPNLDMFGINWYGDCGGEYSLLLHTVENLCEAGSLIHRRIFDFGIYFDENFKLGYEDWDFFLCASEKGFKGANLEDFGFCYRKRPASMLAGSTRVDAAIRSAIRLKHKALYRPKALLQLEASEFPRYAIYLSDKDLFLVGLDPTNESVYQTKEEFILGFWRSQISPNRFFTPPYILTTTSLVLTALKELKLLHWALWRLQMKLDTSHISVLTVSQNLNERYAYIENKELSKGISSAVIVMIAPKILTEVIRDNQSAWFDSFLTSQLGPTISSLAISVPSNYKFVFDESSRHAAVKPSSAASALYRLVHDLRNSRFRTSLQKDWEWRSPVSSHRIKPGALVTREFSTCPAFPKLTTGVRNIGFILPIIEFGGVEKVALNIAKALKEQGWTPHLFIVGSQDAAVSEDWQNAFQTIAFLADGDFSTWGAAKSSYFGTNVPSWGVEGRHDMALSMLYWLDIVINFHGGSISGVMGQLKSFGIKTAISLHLNDLSVAARPVGNVYLGLAYEHDYDYFLPCSNHLAEWCHGMGVPQEKIIPILNAPSFSGHFNELAVAQKKRLERKSSEPLRVLFIGRLDYQKGLDKLNAVIGLAKKEGLAIDWRVVGKAVLADNNSNGYEELSALIEPPVSSAQDLTEVYEWADVLILLSSYEGLPLTILEALRSGVVPIVTDVGAVCEVVTHNLNGILIDTTESISASLHHLQILDCNRAEVRRLSNNAYVSMKERDWTQATQAVNFAFSRKLDQRRTQ